MLRTALATLLVAQAAVPCAGASAEDACRARLACAADEAFLLQTKATLGCVLGVGFYKATTGCRPRFGKFTETGFQSRPESNRRMSSPREAKNFESPIHRPRRTLCSLGQRQGQPARSLSTVSCMGA